MKLKKRKIADRIEGARIIAICVACKNRDDSDVGTNLGIRADIREAALSRLAVPASAPLKLAA